MHDMHLKQKSIEGAGKAMNKHLKKAAAIIFAVSSLALAGCSQTGERDSASGNLNTSKNTKEELSYQGSVVDEDTLEKISGLETMVDAYYYFDVSDEDLRNGLYAGLIAALDDPYAKYYTAEEFVKMQEDNSGEYAGIGVTVRQDLDTGYPIAISITEGSPAENVDILPGDYVVKINDYEIQPADDLDYLVTMIRGEEGTDVTLELYRPDDLKYHSVTITRQIVENRTVSSFMIDDEIGYVRITQFVGNTGTLFEEAVEELEAQGMQGMIIDVRDNPGGMLNVVVDICDYLLPEGMIVYQEDKEGNVLSSYESTAEESFDKPIVVLTNGESASASEILTASLKEYEIATVVGENTFGKGIVQSVIPLADGSAVKLTTAKYFTPLGNDIHGIGVAPDVEISLPDDYTTDDFQGEKDAQYQKGIEVIKEMMHGKAE